MAKKQRGKTTSSTVMEKQKVNLDGAVESSDDEGPDEVTFEESRTEAVRSMKEALDSARREKELLKEKRRKRQELFQEQKKRRLLAADVLEEIDAAPSKKKRQSGDGAEEEEEEQEEEEEGESGKKKKKRGKLIQTRNLLGKYTVTMMKERGAVSFQQQAAVDFIQSRLYGPGCRRTTSNELLSLQNKKGENKSAAVTFVKKNWACKQKAKAEKLKKRWIHKRQVSSS